jgi:hypothetical protein
MPLLVPHALATSWINPGLSNTALKDILNYELDSSLLRHHTVYSLRTSSPRPDGKSADAFFNWNFLREDGGQLSLF